MRIKFKEIKEWQQHFMRLNHLDSGVVTDDYTHDELEELIYILGSLLFYMNMSNKEEI